MGSGWAKNRPPERPLALAALAVAAAGLVAWSYVTDRAVAPSSVSCRPAVLVSGHLRCGDEVPADARDGAVLDADGRITGTMGEFDLAALNVSIDVNRASEVELRSLPGIGPVLADRIVQGRPYETVDALERVKGIGPVRLARLRHRARVR